MWPRKNADPVQACRDRIRKANEQLELSLARDVKNNKKGFFMYTGQKKQTKESVPSLINEKQKDTIHV